MTVQETVHLVIQAAAIGRDGEALVLEMERSVSIDAVARRLIAVVYTAQHEGEKMDEELFGDGEVDERAAHQVVSHVLVPPLTPLTSRKLDPWSSRAEVLKTLEDLSEDLGTALDLGVSV